MNTELNELRSNLSSITLDESRPQYFVGYLLADTELLYAYWYSRKYAVNSCAIEGQAEGSFWNNPEAPAVMSMLLLETIGLITISVENNNYQLTPLGIKVGKLLESYQVETDKKSRKGARPRCREKLGKLSAYGKLRRQDVRRKKEYLR